MRPPAVTSKVIVAGPHMVKRGGGRGDRPASLRCRAAGPCDASGSPIVPPLKLGPSVVHGELHVSVSVTTFAGPAARLDLAPDDDTELLAPLFVERRDIPRAHRHAARALERLTEHALGMFPSRAARPISVPAAVESARSAPSGTPASTSSNSCR